MINIQKLKEIKSELKIKRNNEISNYERKHASFAKTFQSPINGVPCDLHFISICVGNDNAYSSTSGIKCTCIISIPLSNPPVCNINISP
jgi:hypothetical protein